MDTVKEIVSAAVLLASDKSFFNTGVALHLEYAMLASA